MIFEGLGGHGLRRHGQGPQARVPAGSLNLSGDQNEAGPGEVNPCDVLDPSPPPKAKLAPFQLRIVGDPPGKAAREVPETHGFSPGSSVR